MRVDTVRTVDRYLGIPLCCVLTLLRNLKRVLGLEPDASGSPQRIAFIKLSEQGATVLAYRGIMRAVRQVGRENVYFCCFGNNREILDILGCLPPGNVLTIRDDSFFRFAAGVFHALRRMRRLRIDTTIDLELFARISAILAALSGARRRVGLHRFTTEGLYRGDLMTHRVQYNPYVHVSAFCEVLVQAATRDPGETPLAKITVPPAEAPFPCFQPTEEESARVRAMLPENADAVLVIHPKAVDEFLPIRQWPLERFAQTAQKALERRPGAAIVFTGLPAEKALLDTLAAGLGSPRIVNLAGALSLRELLALYTLADVLLTTDGGPAHFAVLTPMDVLVLFGPETPLLYGPPGSRVETLWAGITCRPCLSAANHRRSPCTDAQCMHVISVEAVERKLNDCLARRGR